MNLDTAQLLVRGVRAIAVACAAYGFYYNFGTFRHVYWSPPEADDPPRFREAFYTLSAICVVFYMSLAWVGMELLLGDTEHWFVLFVVMAAEIVFFLILGMLWARSRHAMSIGAATGISSGGLMLQWSILFPVWAPIVVWLARQRLLEP